MTEEGGLICLNQSRWLTTLNSPMEYPVVEVVFSAYHCLAMMAKK